MTEHDRRTAGMLAQTTAIAGGLFAAGVAGVLLDLPNALRLVPALGLGLWFQRLYVVGHEAAHKNLDRARPRFNDAVGQLALLPILVPLSTTARTAATPTAAPSMSTPCPQAPGRCAAPRRGRCGTWRCSPAAGSCTAW